jgi:hypothetical protein
MSLRLSAFIIGTLVYTLCTLHYIQGTCVNPIYSELTLNELNFDWDVESHSTGTLPQGAWTIGGVPFQFTNDGTIYNAYKDPSDHTLTITVNKANVGEVYTSLNTMWGYTEPNTNQDKVGNITFNFDDSSSITYSLSGNFALRDYGPAYSQVFNSPETINYETNNQVKFDRQVWLIPFEKQALTLVDIVIEDFGAQGASSVMVLGATVAQCDALSVVATIPIDMGSLYNYDWVADNPLPQPAGSGQTTSVAQYGGNGGAALPTSAQTFDGVSFNLSPDQHVWTGYQQDSDNSEYVLTLPVGATRVVEVYTLMTAFWADYGEHGTVKFVYADGVNVSVPIRTFWNLRDHSTFPGFSATTAAQVEYDPKTELVYTDTNLRMDMQRFPAPTDRLDVQLDSIEIIDTGDYNVNRLIVAAASWGTDTNCVPDNHTMCTYEPPAPLHTAQVSGSNYIVTVTHLVGEYDNGVRVVFPDSDTGNVCDFNSNDNSNNYWSVSTSECNITYTLSIPSYIMMSQCGFSQRAVGNLVQFYQNVDVLTNRSCTDDRNQEFDLTRTSSFPINITTPNTVTGTVGDLQVYGAAYALSLLGDLVVDPNFDTGVVSVSGSFATSIQHPYMLEYLSSELDSVFNVSTFNIIHDSCIADNTDPHDPCEQVWNFTVLSSVNCQDVPTPTGFDSDQINITFSPNCSLGFDGECAPEFALDIGFTFSISSSDFCVITDEIVLDSTITSWSYAADDSTNQAIRRTTTTDGTDSTMELSNVPGPNFGAGSIGVLADSSDWAEEFLFTEESVYYGELQVSTGSTVTLTSTGIIKITVMPALAGQDDIVVYDANAAISNTDVAIFNDTFGTDSDASFADTRARFAIQWINGSTMNLDPSIEADQTMSVEVVSVAVFTSEQSQNAGGSDNDNAIMQSFHRDQYSQEQLFTAEATTESRRPTALKFAAITPKSAAGDGPSGSGSGDTSQSSSSIVDAMGGSTVIGVVAAVVVAALVVTVVVQKKRHNASTSTSSNSNDQTICKTLPVTSSQHMISLETICTNYDNDQEFINASPGSDVATTILPLDHTISHVDQ